MDKYFKSILWGLKNNHLIFSLCDKTNLAGSFSMENVVSEFVPGAVLESTLFVCKICWLGYFCEILAWNLSCKRMWYSPTVKNYFPKF